jgi:hypothetical protein
MRQEELTFLQKTEKFLKPPQYLPFFYFPWGQVVQGLPWFAKPCQVSIGFYQKSLG